RGWPAPAGGGLAAGGTGWEGRGGGWLPSGRGGTRMGGGGWLLSGMLALWVGLAAAGVPEVPRLRTLGVADGLPATGINAIVRDQAGFVLIGSADCLARCYGIGFTVWRHE